MNNEMKKLIVISFDEGEIDVQVAGIHNNLELIGLFALAQRELLAAASDAVYSNN